MAASRGSICRWPPTRTGTTRTTSTATSRTSTPPRSTTCRTFFKTYYAPNNAVLVVTGDFDAATVEGLDREVLRRHSARRSCRRSPISRSRDRRRRSASPAPIRWRTARRSASATTCPIATRPSGTPSGCSTSCSRRDATRCFYDELVRKRGLTGGVDAGINFGLGNMFDYSGPMLWIASVLPRHRQVSSDALLAAVRCSDRAAANDAGRPATLERALVKMRSALYAELEQFAGFGRADLLASFALFDDDPARINQLEDGVRAR